MAAVLSRQLEQINALLSVRPDHADAPRSTVLTGQDGASFRVSGNNVSALPPTQAATAFEGQEQELSFTSEAEARAWIAEQRAKGFEVHITRRETQARYFTEPMHAPLILGGPEGLRAIAYVALTFLAHHFPDAARCAGMLPIKDYVQERGDTQHAWWENSHQASVLGDNPFRFGHATGVAVSAETGRAWARVEQFSTLVYSVDLGPVDASSDETVVTFINPLAEHPPADIFVSRRAGLLFQVERPSDLTEHLRAMIASGVAQQQFSRLIRGVEAWNRERAFTPLVGEIHNAALLAPADRNRLIRSLIDDQGQRIVNLMGHVAKGDASTKTPGAAPIMSAFAAMTTGDPKSSSGLSPTGEAALAAAKDGLCRQIESECQGMTLDRLTMLLGGGAGAYVVGQAMLEIALDQLPPQAPLG